MSIVTTDNNHYKSIANTVREGAKSVLEKIGVEVPEGAFDGVDMSPSEMPGKVQSLFDETFAAAKEFGEKAERDRFWDAYQQNGGRTDYTNAFRNYLWTDVTYDPKYSIKAERLASCFQTCNQIKSTKVPIQYISDRQESSVFSGCTNLVTIPSITVRESNTFSSWFNSCEKLQNVTFMGTIGNSINLQWSPLSKASIESIVGCLSTTTSGLSVTLAQTAVDATFTDEEWATLANTRPNWTINLV
jgi:exopolysaccharide biosynthesis predicted pyruvyltransferase EpsI